MRVRFTAIAFGAATAVVAVSFSASADPAPSFGGAYIGLYAGAAWGSSDYSTDPGCAPAGVGGTFCVDSPDPSVVNGTAVANSGTGKLSSTGFTGGVQGGYNWQSGRIVYGGEADFGAFDLGNSVVSTGTFPFPFLGTSYAVTEHMSTNWLATLRGRIGVTVMPALLLYATGGIAFSDFKFSSSYADNAIGAGFPGGAGSGTKSGVRTGWAVGGGGEWLLDACWSIKAEYLYVDFGSRGVSIPVSNTAANTQTMRVNSDLSASLARVGLNYRY